MIKTNLTFDRKSMFRKPIGISLGPQYTGSTISRDDLLAEGSDDDPFGSGASKQEESAGDIDDTDPDEDLQVEEVNVAKEEAFQDGVNGNTEKFANRRSKKQGRKRDRTPLREVPEEVDDLSFGADEELEALSIGINGGGHESDGREDEDSDDIEMEDEGGMSEGDTDGSSMEGRGKRSQTDERAELRKMMAEEQKTVLSTISKAAKADVTKGQAIKHQRSTFDTLLNTRIRLQKALVATNSLFAESPSAGKTEPDIDAVQAAEHAALNLWNTLDDLRQSLQNTAVEKRPTSKKRSFSATVSTPSSTLSDRMQQHESTFLAHRRTILSKWSSRVHVSATLQPRNALSTASMHQPLTSVLDQQLSAPNNARLIARTRVPRSCAPLQAAKKVLEDRNIYDDADFYTLLLRELVDQRMSSTNHNNTNANTNTSSISNGTTLLPLKVPKIRKQVDTKASKGRKMRYTVHEELQNFMAPEDRGTWGERQAKELFASLLGAKVVLDEEDDGGGKGDGVEEEGLRLFRA